MRKENRIAKAYQRNAREGYKQPVQVLLIERILEVGTLKEAADAIGKRPEYLSRVLDGSCELKWETVLALCGYLGISNPREVIV